MTQSIENGIFPKRYLSHLKPSAFHCWPLPFFCLKTTSRHYLGMHNGLGKFSYSAFAKSPEWIASMMARVSYTFPEWHIAQIDHFAMGIIGVHFDILELLNRVWLVRFPRSSTISRRLPPRDLIERIVAYSSAQSFKLMRWPAPKAPPVHPVLMSQAFTLCFAILGHGQKFTKSMVQTSKVSSEGGSNSDSCLCLHLSIEFQVASTKFVVAKWYMQDVNVL